jgi:hypothetical protein
MKLLKQSASKQQLETARQRFIDCLDLHIDNIASTSSNNHSRPSLVPSHYLVIRSRQYLMVLCSLLQNDASCAKQAAMIFEELYKIFHAWQLLSMHLTIRIMIALLKFEFCQAGNARNEMFIRTLWNAIRFALSKRDSSSMGDVNQQSCHISNEVHLLILSRYVQQSSTSSTDRTNKRVKLST